MSCPLADGNTIANVGLGVLLGGGRRNRIHANSFENCDFDIHFVSFMQHASYETQTYLTACCLVHHVCCRITAAWPPATHVA